MNNFIQRRINFEKDLTDKFGNLKDFISQEYLDKKNSAKDTALKMGVSIDWIYIYCKRNDIKLRTFKEGALTKIKQQRLDFKLNYEEKQIILGTLLGDASLDRGCKRINGQRMYSSNSYPYYTVFHCEKQKEYSLWLKERLTRFGADFDKNKRLTTKVHTEFLSIWEQLYCRDYRKYFTYEYLMQIDALGLAAWYMDDGHRGKTSITIGKSLKDEQEFLNIQKYFKDKWSLDCRYCRNSISFRVEESQKFTNIVKPYIVDCMRYKELPIMNIKNRNYSRAKNTIHDNIIKMIEQNNKYRARSYAKVGA